MSLIKFPRALHRAKITARPSASNKSPYLVDVVLDDDPAQQPQIAHNPALLCGGRLDKGAIVYVMAAPEASKGLSKFQVMLLEAEGTLIITNPQVANQIAAEIIKQGHLGWIPTALKAEVTHGESRFDFGGELVEQASDFSGSRQVDNKPFFVEVKSAPLLDATGQAAIFPVGNRKHKANDPVSPRAVKQALRISHIIMLSARHMKQELRYTRFP